MKGGKRPFRDLLGESEEEAPKWAELNRRGRRLVMKHYGVLGDWRKRSHTERRSIRERFGSDIVEQEVAAALELADTSTPDLSSIGNR